MTTKITTQTVEKIMGSPDFKGAWDGLFSSRAIESLSIKEICAMFYLFGAKHVTKTTH